MSCKLGIKRSTEDQITTDRTKKRFLYNDALETEIISRNELTEWNESIKNHTTIFGYFVVLVYLSFSKPKGERKSKFRIDNNVFESTHYSLS